MRAENYYSVEHAPRHPALEGEPRLAMFRFVDMLRFRIGRMRDPENHGCDRDKKRCD